MLSEAFVAYLAQAWRAHSSLQATTTARDYDRALPPPGAAPDVRWLVGSAVDWQEGNSNLFSSLLTGCRAQAGPSSVVRQTQMLA